MIDPRPTCPRCGEKYDPDFDPGTCYTGHPLARIPGSSFYSEWAYIGKDEERIAAIKYFAPTLLYHGSWIQRFVFAALAEREHNPSLREIPLGDYLAAIAAGMKDNG